MKTLNVIVTNKIATYQTRCGDIVCGNNDYQINFTFDSEWDAFSKKTARFIVNGRYTDVDFTGTTCPVPIITDTDKVTVGVYAGDLCTTTPATIGCKPSILCGSQTASVENDKKYANEAKEAAERAAEEAREEIAKVIGELGVVQTPGNSPVAVMSQKAVTDCYNRNDKRITNLEQGLPEDNFITDDSVSYAKSVPEGALPYAEITKVGGMTYKEGDTLKHAKVTKVISAGENLIKYAGITPHSKTKNGVTYTINEDYSITINGTSTQDHWIMLSDTSTNNTQWNEATAKPIPHDYYTASMEVISGSHNYTYGVICVGFYTPSSAEGTTALELKDTQSITSPHIATKINSIYVVAPTGTVFNNFTFKLQVQRGTQATEIIIPTVRTIEIPTAVQTLDGYGVGVSDEYYNYIDWENKVFVKRIGSIDLGALNWEIWESDNPYFRASANIAAATNALVICEKYQASTIWYINNTDVNNAIGAESVIIQIRDFNYTDINAFKTALQGVMLYYELAETEYIDISNLITADNFIEVEGGGTIIAENENNLAVPSEIEYQVEV